MSYLVNRPAQNDVSDLQSLSGVPDGSANLGTFTGNTVQDNRTVKQALQDLETEVEDRLPDFVQWQRKDGGYYFDGTNDYQQTSVKVGGFTKLSGIVAFSIPTGTIPYQSLIGEYDTNTNNRAFTLDVSSNGEILLIVSSDGLSGTIKSWTAPAGTVVAGGNYVIGFSLDGTSATIYVNGEAVSAVESDAGYTGTLFTTNETGVAIGARSQPASYTKGTIRFVRLFNRALSASDVAKYSRGEATDFSDRVANTTDLQTGSWFNSTSASLQFSNFSGSATGFTADYNNANSSNRSVIALTKTLVPGKRYRASFTLDTDGASVRVYTMSTDAGGGAMDIQAVSAASATATSVEFVQGATTGAFWGFLVNSVPSSGSIAVSNFTLKEIGEVASYLSESSTPTLWADVSPLGRHATNNGATHIFNRRLYADAVVIFSNLQTSAAGLAAGQVWRDGNDLKIV